MSTRTRPPHDEAPESNAYLLRPPPPPEKLRRRRAEVPPPTRLPHDGTPSGLTDSGLGFGMSGVGGSRS